MKAKFAPGDKVFAKVKGFPPWPAWVKGLALKTNRYHIYFYGTGETAIVKAKDICSFVENKARLGKPNKHKKFMEGLLQIEADLTPEEQQRLSKLEEDNKNQLEISNDSIGDNSKRIKNKTSLSSNLTKSNDKKRKISNKSGSDTPNQSKRVSLKAKFTPEENVFVKIKGYPEWPAWIIEQKTSNTYQVCFYGKGDTAVVKEKYICSFVENKARLGKPIKHKKFMEALLQVELSPEEQQKLSKLEEGNRKQSGISNDSIGEDHTKTSSVGSKRTSEDDSSLLQKKKVFIASNSGSETADGLAKPVAVLSHSLSPETKMDEQTRDLAGRKNCNIIQENDPRYEDIKIQAHLLELELDIRSALSVKKKKKNMQKCISCLDRLKDLEITALMLKKYPDVVSTIIKVRRYVGIIPKMIDKAEKEKLKADAETIRNKAELIYQKFQNLFSIPVNKSFEDVFEKERQRFDENTCHMNDEDIIALINDP